MSFSGQNPQNVEHLLKLVEDRVAKDITAVVVAPGVSEIQREQLATMLKGKTPVIAIKGESLVEPNALTKIEALYEVVTMETKVMKYFAPEALLRGIKEGFAPLLDRRKLKLSPIEGVFDLINSIFPRGISGAIMAGIIATECLGSAIIGTDKNILAVAGSTRAGNLDTVLVLKASRIKDALFQRDQPLVREILAMPRIVFH